MAKKISERMTLEQRKFLLNRVNECNAYRLREQPATKPASVTAAERVVAAFEAKREKQNQAVREQFDALRDAARAAINFDDIPTARAAVDKLREYWLANSEQR